MSHDLVSKTLAYKHNDSPNSLTSCSVGGVFYQVLIFDCSPLHLFDQKLT